MPRFASIVAASLLIVLILILGGALFQQRHSIINERAFYSDMVNDLNRAVGDYKTLYDSLSAVSSGGHAKDLAVLDSLDSRFASCLVADAIFHGARGLDTASIDALRAKDGMDCEYVYGRLLFLEYHQRDPERFRAVLKLAASLLPGCMVPSNLSSFARRWLDSDEWPLLEYRDAATCRLDIETLLVSASYGASIPSFESALGEVRNSTCYKSDPSGAELVLVSIHADFLSKLREYDLAREVIEDALAKGTVDPEGREVLRTMNDSIPTD